MAALVGAMGEGGRGVFMLTKGGAHADAVPRIARRRQRPAGDGRGAAAQQHQSAARCSTTSTRSRAANARGHRLLGQVSCCPLTMDFTLASPYPVEGLASWKPALGLHGDGAEGGARRAGLSATAVRAELATPATFRLFNGEWDKVQVVEAATPGAARATSSARSPTIAARSGRDPLDTMLDLALAEDLETVFTAQLLNSDEEAVGRMLQPPAQHRQPERRRRAPDLLQRRRLRPAPARPLGARAAAR